MTGTCVFEHPPPCVPASGDGSYCHLWCCDPDVALCGADISGEEECDDPGHVICVLCTLAADAGMPCPVPGCPEGSGGG